MEKLILGLGAALLAVMMLFFGSVIGGTILWAIYEHIFAMFPNAVEQGVLSPTLEWWDAVCVTWIFAILIKSSKTTTNKNK